LEYECELLRRHAASEDPLDLLESYDSDSEIELAEQLIGLDLGVASSVVALAAAGCISFSSCNGGVLGDHHHEDYPQVSFFARRPSIRVLLACAEISGAGLENESGGALQVYADDTMKMIGFAQELLRLRAKLPKRRR